jgi:dienelactone hydrolase
MRRALLAAAFPAPEAAAAFFSSVPLPDGPPPVERVDASRFSGEFYWTADLVRSFEALRQTMLDARTLLAWLLARDPRPVGVAGLSLGGALTLSLACVEERFAFAVPIIAHMDLAALVTDAPVLAKMRHDLKSFGWRKEHFDAFIRGIGWYELRPKLPADPVLMIAASEDRFFDPRLVRRLWRDWAGPRSGGTRRATWAS